MSRLAATPETPSSRIQIERVTPVVDDGRYPVKRTLGDSVAVEADVFRDGHDVLGASLLVRAARANDSFAVPMTRVELEPDRWRASFDATDLGRWEFTIEAWVDTFASWRWELERKADAGQEDLASELAEGALLLGVEELTLDEGLATNLEIRSEATPLGRWLVVDVDRVQARFGAWYELFPRSWGGFKGVERLLPRLAELGFDVVYLPPIHPIGRTHRKGRNNALVAAPGDPGSPWAIGAEEGGHTGVHPELGTMKEFERLVARGAELGVEIALDFAIQCSPDHPWLVEHPTWFNRRPDGTLKYAENPPKRYQDIYNVNFDSPDWRELWEALRDVVLFWVERGVKIFRVDNPHTKPVPFWEWLIRTVRDEHPDVIFLAEAFTRPPMMRLLGKIGFSQSYTYFTWKNSRAELTEYLTELAGPMSEYYRPNFFTNTPDILHAYLQHGGRPAFEARLVLAATLSPSYGIYSGFEQCENVPVRDGSEEYVDSEKYELKERTLDGPLVPLIAKLNTIRRENAALQRLPLTFLESGNDSLLAYAKRSGENAVVMCVNLDPEAEQSGAIEVPAGLGVPESFAVADLLSGERYRWTLGKNFVSLAAGGSHVLRVEA
ncbi:MAG: alpha-1,4-glucan--maltose-1-phosphate maltosyltransferase [Gaiellaceae bacterium]